MKMGIFLVVLCGLEQRTTAEGAGSGSPWAEASGGRGWGIHVLWMIGG